MTENKNNTVIDSIWKKSWFRIGSITAIVFVLALVALPFGISKAMKSWLEKNGADNVSIEDVDFNPFTGTAALKGLDVRIAGKAVASNSLLTIDVSLTDLLNKGVFIKAATIDKLVVDIEQSADGKIRIGSLIIEPSKPIDNAAQKEIKEKVSWWLGLRKVSLSQWEIHYTSPQLTTTLYIDSASLEDLSTRPGDQTARLDIKARLNKSDIKATIHMEELTPELKAGGDISLQNINLGEFIGFTAGTLDKLTGLVDMSGKFSAAVSSTGGIDVRYTGNAGISNTDVNNQDFAITGTALNWDGSISVKTQTDSAQKIIKLDGELGAKELALSLVDQKLSIQQQEISLDQQLSMQLSDEVIDLNVTGNILASGTRVEDMAKGLTLLAINKLDVSGVNVVALDKVKISDIKLQETDLIQSLKSGKPTFAINNAVITDLIYTGDSVSIQKVALEKLTGSIIREKDGSIDINNLLQKADKNADVATTEKEPVIQKTGTNVEKAATTAPFGIKISEISVTDDSLFSFTDRTVSPAFKSVLDIASLKITDIDSSKPDQAVAIKLDSKLNTYATLAVKGSVRPFKEQPSVDLKVKLDNQNMVSLSPYAIAATGYLIRAGQLNIDSTVVIKDGHIDSKNALFMKKLRMDKADETAVKNNEASIGMPLDKALGLLRDRKDNIKLDMPITGKLDEVEFGTGQIINTALKKATTAGMKTYLLYAFQPYGTLIIAGEAVGKQMGKISLDPVVFEAGKGELDDKQKDYLKKLGKVMLDRPKIDVQICAYTTMADLSIKKDSEKNKETGKLSQRQKDKSIKLGQDREKAIKDFLISYFNINNGRLILCSPQYDDGKEASPRVELRI